MILRVIPVFAALSIVLVTRVLSPAAYDWVVADSDTSHPVDTSYQSHTAGLRDRRAEAPPAEAEEDRREAQQHEAVVDHENRVDHVG